MKLLIVTIMTIVSLNATAYTITATNSEMIELGNEFRKYSSEDLGELLKYKCTSGDRELNCEFKYDLPEDYCWYGKYYAKATYVLDTHPGLRIVERSHETVWKAE